MNQKIMCTSKCVDMSLPGYRPDSAENGLKSRLTTAEKRHLDEIATKSLMEDGFLTRVSVH